MQDNKTKFIGLIVIALLAIGGTGAVVLVNRQDTEQTTSPDTTANDPSTNVATPRAEATDSGTSTSTTYQDGTYDADGSYRTPGGTEKVNVTVTLANDKITKVDVKGSGQGDSAEYQSMFKQGISNLVVGKSIDDINVSRISGSSLTSTGFNNAIETIKQEATSAA